MTLQVDITLDFTAIENGAAAEQIEAAVADALPEAAEIAELAVLRNLGFGSGSGIQHPSLPFRSSAVGEFPVRQSGELAASVFSEVRALGIVIGATAPHAAILEESGRPFLVPSVEEVEGEIVALIGARIEALNAGGAADG